MATSVTLAKAGSPKSQVLQLQYYLDLQVTKSCSAGVAMYIHLMYLHYTTVIINTDVIWKKDLRVRIAVSKDNIFCATCN